MAFVLFSPETTFQGKNYMFFCDVRSIPRRFCYTQTTKDTGQLAHLHILIRVLVICFIDNTCPIDSHLVYVSAYIVSWFVSPKTVFLHNQAPLNMVLPYEIK